MAAASICVQLRAEAQTVFLFQSAHRDCRTPILHILALKILIQMDVSATQTLARGKASGRRPSRPSEKFPGRGTISGMEGTMRIFFSSALGAKDCIAEEGLAASGSSRSLVRAVTGLRRNNWPTPD
jgi:hypothetical protein